MSKQKLLSLLIIFVLTMSTIGSATVVLAQDPTDEPPPVEETVESTEEAVEEETTASEEPTEEPTAEPTEEPTAEPTEEPTAEPTEEPTAEPTEEPTAEPTEEPTAEPTEEPTAEPTEEPTAEPTEEPTAEPTEEPTAEPTEEPVVELPVIDSFVADPTAVTIEAGAVATSTLSWVITGAITTTLNGEVVDGTGQQVVEVTETTTFILAAENEAGVVDKQVVISVEPPAVDLPTINSFIADPITVTIEAGAVATSTLSWDVTGAVTTTLNGEVVEGTERVVEVTETTTFTLAAENETGVVENQVAVTVDVLKLEAAGDIEAQAYDTSFSTKVYAVNMGTGASNIAIAYYKDDGSSAGGDPACSSVPAGGQCIFDGSSLSDGFRGSGVIQSSEPTGAVVRIVGSSEGRLSDYTGVTSSQGGTPVFLPSVHRSNWRTMISTQNLGNTTTDIILKIRDSSGAVVKTVTASNVASNQSAYFNLFDASYAADLGSNFGGSATVEAGDGTQPLYAIVQENNTQHGGVFAYEGFGPNDGASTIFYPALHRNRANDFAGTGWNSSTFIQNLNSSNPVTVKVTWKDDSGLGGAVAKTATYVIPANSSQYLTTYNEPSNRNGWGGNMKVEVTGGTGPIAGISSEIYQKGTASVPVISAYAEYRAVKEGYKYLYSPIAEGHYNGSNNTGEYTRFFVQNMSSTDVATITVEWINPSTGATAYSPSAVVIGADGSAYFNPNSFASTVHNFSGTFKVTAQGAPVAGIVYDSTLGSSTGEPGYPRDTTGIFNFPGTN